jgi:hypothetical protein
MARRVGVLLLNELATVEYNAYTKCFASRRQAKSRAFGLLSQDFIINTNPNILERFVAGLHAQMKMKGPPMTDEITPESIIEMGAWAYKPMILERLTLEERLDGIEDYLEEQRRASAQATLIRNLLRSLELRFQLDEVTLQAYQARFEQCELETLEHLLEKLILVADELAFQQAVDDLAPPIET